MVIVLGVLIVVGYLTLSSRQPDRYLNYTNARYNFSVDYPAEWQLGEPPSNNDGREMIAPDKQTVCRAYGFANALTGSSGGRQSVDEYVEWLSDNRSDSSQDFQTPAKRETTLAGRRALWVVSDKDNIFEDAIYTLDQETGYGLSCAYPDTGTQSAMRDTFERMRAGMKIGSAPSY